MEWEQEALNSFSNNNYEQQNFVLPHVLFITLIFFKCNFIYPEGQFKLINKINYFQKSSINIKVYCYMYVCGFYSLFFQTINF